MKWFNKWFAKKCKQAWEDSRADSPIKESLAAQLVAARSIDSHGMNFTIYRANGGYVIETRTYDKKRDSNDHNLHIITDDKELGEEIGKIITYQSLRS
jgi:hypothetical protein